MPSLAAKPPKGHVAGPGPLVRPFPVEGYVASIPEWPCHAFLVSIIDPHARLPQSCLCCHPVAAHTPLAEGLPRQSCPLLPLGRWCMPLRSKAR